VTEIDSAFELARLGNDDGFEQWLRLVEIPVRASLRPFARAVDVEAAVQETLLRMFLVVRDPERRLVGRDASLRFAIRVARNVAMEQVRHLRHETLVDPADLEQEGPCCDPDPLADPALRRAILSCIERLPQKPREALLARLKDGHTSPNRDVAASVRMLVNTFLQNITRARKLLARCLEERGVHLPEVRP
jgi:DNA-directed RNA polymerase specialized sigma24 family protein